MKKTAFLMVLIFSLFGCVKNDVLVPYSPTINERISNIYNSSVSITDGTGEVFGAGTIIWNRAGEKMIVLTAAHVVTSMQNKGLLIRISLTHESGYRPMIVKPMIVKKINKKTDLALLEGMDNQKIGGPMVLIASQPPKIGDRLTVIGAPMGDERTVTSGILSKIQEFSGEFYYRISAATFFGNSGGGAFNRNGELVGVAHAIQMVNFFIVVPGAAFFISLDNVKSFL
jgi:S1-C subfamily serine protease